jgi:hypothetical protein
MRGFGAIDHAGLEWLQVANSCDLHDGIKDVDVLVICPVCGHERPAYAARRDGDARSSDGHADDGARVLPTEHRDRCCDTTPGDMTHPRTRGGAT